MEDFPQPGREPERWYRERALADEQPYDDVNLHDMRGRTVIDSRGATVGRIEDVAIDPREWKVSGFIIDVRRDLAERFGLAPAGRGGLFESGRPTRINLGSERVKTFGENVLLNVDTMEIASLLHRSAPPGPLSDLPP